MSRYDLASLTKPLVTAPLAVAFLDLEADRREALGFPERRTPLTARQLLSHSAGLPPWLPFRGEGLAGQLRRGWPLGEVPLLRLAEPGRSTYSDLGYRLLAELLETETGVAWRDLGRSFSGLRPAPWPEDLPPIPPGPDREAWEIAAPDLPFPPASPRWPHDANARAGMKGHAGFSATAEELRGSLQRWMGARWHLRMCQPVADSAEGAQWGLGIQVALDGPGRFGSVLARFPEGCGGLHVLEDPSDELPPPVPPVEGRPGNPSGWWFHTGFTGPMLCVRPSDGCCIGLLCHRRGPGGRLLELDELRARRWVMLERLLATLGT